jgi:hypothetical protein
LGWRHAAKITSLWDEQQGACIPGEILTKFATQASLTADDGT